MRYITKDEIYNWVSCRERVSADAQIPDDLHQRLSDSIVAYQRVCNEICGYLENHPDDEFSI